MCENFIGCIAGLCMFLWVDPANFDALSFVDWDVMVFVGW